ncbi:MAG: hypothetical protein AAF519_16315 [Bacteroidota bacterium]
MAKTFVILGLSTTFMFAGIKSADAKVCEYSYPLNDYMAVYECDDGSIEVAMRPITISSE